MLISYARGETSIILRVKILNSSVSTGAGLTGLAFNSSGLIIGTMADNEATSTVYTVSGSTIETITTLGTYAAPTATKCRFKEVDSTNHKGVYEIHLADARYAVSSAKSLVISISGATNAAETDVVIPLTDVDLYDGEAGGMSDLSGVWSAASRTLTQTGASVAAAVDGDSVTLYRGDTLSISLSGLGDISARTKLWFTGKYSKSDIDSAAQLQVEETAGLVYINATAPESGETGTITVTDESAGDVTIAVSADASDNLVPLSQGYWDLQMLTSSGVTTLTTGTLVITGDVTRAVE